MACKSFVSGTRSHLTRKPFTIDLNLNRRLLFPKRGCRLTQSDAAKLLWARSSHATPSAQHQRPGCSTQLTGNPATESALTASPALVKVKVWIVQAACLIWRLRVDGGSLVARVQVHDNESIESAIRRFKRQVAREGIITDTKKHAFYLKPGERRRLKSQVARRRARKSLKKRLQED